MVSNGCSSTSTRVPPGLRTRHTAHPGVEVVNPAQDADGGVHEVEAIVEFFRKVSRVRFENRDHDAAALGQISKALQSDGGEVHAGHDCPLTRHGDGVAADMTLEVQDVASADAGAGRCTNDGRRLFITPQGPSGH
jgi:hypothetical protein